MMHYSFICIFLIRHSPHLFVSLWYFSFCLFKSFFWVSNRIVVFYLFIDRNISIAVFITLNISPF